jgi:hypothetical protein
VTVNADGSFVYVPPAGLSGTTDAFTYRITDPAGAHADATVQVGIGADLVWYVDSAAGGSGDGRSTAPFTSLAPLRGGGDADAAGDIIFVYQGSGAYGGGMPLEADQDLVGQPAGLTVAGHALVAAGGSRPVITNTAGDGVGLAGGVSIRSVTVSNASRDGIAGVNTTGVAVSDVVVTGSGRDGVHLAGSGAGSIGLTLADSSVADSTGTGLLVRGSGSTTADVGATGSTFDGNGIGVNVVGSASDALTFDVSDNDFIDQAGNAVQILTAAPTAGQADAEVIRGQVRDNVVGGTAAGSGSRDLIGIAIEINGDADAVVAVTGNTVSHTDQEGIFVQARLDNDGDGAHGRLDLTLRDNTVGTPEDDSAFPIGLVHGIRIESRNTTDVCLDLAANDSSSVGGGSDIHLRQRDGSTFRLERFSGSGTSHGDVVAFAIAQNAAGTTASATHATSYTGVADGTCRAP